MIYPGFYYSSAVQVRHIPSNIEIVIKERSLHKCRNIALSILKSKLYAMENLDMVYNQYDYVLPDSTPYPNELDEYRKLRSDYNEIEKKDTI